MSESLFMRLDSQGATSSLTQQYRMNGPIMKIANHLMYENQLQCAIPDLETAIFHLPNYNVRIMLTFFTLSTHYSEGIYLGY